MEHLVAISFMGHPRVLGLLPNFISLARVYAWLVCMSCEISHVLVIKKKNHLGGHHIDYEIELCAV